MKLSVYDVSYEIYKSVTKEEDKLLKTNIINSVIKLAREGWTMQEILSKACTYDGDMDLMKFFKGRKKSQQNLIDPLEFKYHSELRISPPSVEVEFDMETGEFKREHQEYYLEMTGSYTIDDLEEYYILKEKLYVKEAYNEKRVKGALNYLLGKGYSVQEILYMMDIANGMLKNADLPPVNEPLYIEQYITLAKKAIESKITESIINGDDKIVYRKRL